MIWLYVVGGLIALLVVTYAANSATKRRQARQELRERRIKFMDKHGGPVRRLFRRFRIRR